MTKASSTQTDYARPFRPLAVRAFNALGRGNPHKQFNPDRLFAAAQKTAGETELSGAPLMEPLRKLCSSILQEANLSPFGRVIQSTRLKTLITNRLRLDALMRKHPEILRQPDPDVLLIAGLARTGTTMLHRTLAADPAARSLPSWEALNPAPVPGDAPGDPGSRLKLGRFANKMMNWLAPDFAAVHPVSAEAPEEDILLLDLTMMSQTAEAVTYVPSYSTWLESVDHRPAYAYLRDVMKTLQWLRPGPGKSTHWVLKSPHHGEQLAAVFDTFPKATIIQTHRDPQVTTASCSSLMCHTHALSTDHPNPERIARHWLRKSRLMAENAIGARTANPERAVVDITYKRLMENPAAAISDIYSAHGEPLTEAGRDIVIAAARRSSKPKGKSHAYALSDFGLTESDVQEAFANYLTHYKLFDLEAAR